MKCDLLNPRESSNEPPPRNPSKTRFLRQSISLTGLGTQTFEESRKAVIAIYTLLGGYVDRSKLRPCLVGCDYGEDSGFDASNRSFTSTREAPMDKHTPFSDDVDPNGVLACLVTATYVHSESNIVDYAERIKDSSGKVRYGSQPIDFCTLLINVPGMRKYLQTVFKLELLSRPRLLLCWSQ